MDEIPPAQEDPAETMDTDQPSKSELTSVTKRVQVKARGKVMGVVRENYLREDIPCRSALCFEHCNNTTSASSHLLPESVTHYIIPMMDVAKQYLEILDYTDITGIIFLQTVVNSVQQASLKQYRRICSLVRDSRKGSVFFPNEFSKPTFVHRETGMSITDWQVDMAFKAASWYYEHLGGQKPLVLLTEDDKVVQAFGNRRVEIFVYKVEDYLKDFWPNLPDALEVYKSLADAISAEKDTGDLNDYFEYYKPELLEAGVKSGKFTQGRLKVNKHHASTEAFASRSGGSEDEQSSDILIPGMVCRNRAIHGDVVVVELLPKSLWKSRSNRLAGQKEEEEERWERRADVEPTGKVVGVVQRNWRECIATIPKEEENALTKRAGKRILVYPYDYRIPKIRILTSQAKTLVRDRIVVRIDNWPVNSQYPNGHFVRTLGKIGDLETEIDGILLENSIEITPFSQGILAEMPKDDWRPDPEEVSKRKDLRGSHLIMSIDPIGCEDVDDALSVRKLKNGNLELGVHIADVTHFVRHGSLTDLEARRRATTVYLADRRYDMLPSVLSANVCSLLGSVDRYAVSVLWELDPKSYKVVSVWYGRTVIRSAYKLFYEAAQDILDGKTEEEMQEAIPELAAFKGQGLTKKFKQVKEHLVLLSSIARKIQSDRERDGALQLESTEVQFEFKETRPDDIKPKQHLQIHETVAECMIFANHWVAKKIAKSFPHQALLRRHPPPKKENFEELQKCALSKGWRVEIWCNKVLAESLNRCTDPKDPSVNFLLRSLATYAMVQAQYFSTGSVKDWHHYGLALEQYTHFTSPIRRYADMIVHRLLMLAIANQDWWANEGVKQEDLFGNAALQELCEHINERNRAAQMAQRSSQELFQTLYFKDKAVDDPRCIVEGVIFSIRANGFLVYIPAYALKGPVYLQNAEQQVLYHHKNHGPMWQSGVLWADEYAIHVETVDGKQSYRLFDHVTITIQMTGSDSHACKLRYYLLSNRKPTSSTKPTVLDVNFLRELRKERDRMEEETEEEKPKKKKAKKPSMYEFFEEMKELGVTKCEK